MIISFLIVISFRNIQFLESDDAGKNIHRQNNLYRIEPSQYVEFGDGPVCVMIVDMGCVYVKYITIF